MIHLPDHVSARCRQFGREIVEHYSRGGSPNSRAVSYNGAEQNVEYQTIGKLAECVFAAELDLDPTRVVKWDLEPDRGWDFGRWLRVDVKATTLRGRRLIWPLGKRHIFDHKKFDALILVKVDSAAACGFSAGWILKDDFRREMKVAGADDPTRLHDGTWYVDAADLRPISPFLATYRRGA